MADAGEVRALLGGNEGIEDDGVVPLALESVDDVGAGDDGAPGMGGGKELGAALDVHGHGDVVVVAHERFAASGDPAGMEARGIAAESGVVGAMGVALVEIGEGVGGGDTLSQGDPVAVHGGDGQGERRARGIRGDERGGGAAQLVQPGRVAQAYAADDTVDAVLVRHAQR